MHVEKVIESYDINVVSKKIFTDKPYFSFQNLWREENTLYGSFSPEQLKFNEVGEISTSEVGRHLAILGSCTAVTLIDGVHGYYLANNALITRSKINCKNSKNKAMHASAEILNYDKRKLKISAKLWSDEVIAELICDYTILPSSIFQRKFRNYASDDLSPPPQSPYINPIDLDKVVIKKNSAQACIRAVDPQKCAGHFNGYPCWPVIILAQAGFQLISKWIDINFWEKTYYRVLDFKLSAQKLMSVSDSIEIMIDIKENHNKINLISCDIYIYHESYESAKISITIEILV